MKKALTLIIIVTITGCENSEVATTNQNKEKQRELINQMNELYRFQQEMQRYEYELRMRDTLLSPLIPSQNSGCGSSIAGINNYSILQPCNGPLGDIPLYQ